MSTASSVSALHCAYFLVPFKPSTVNSKPPHTLNPNLNSLLGFGTLFDWCGWYWSLLEPPSSTPEKKSCRMRGELLSERVLGWMLRVRREEFREIGVWGVGVFSLGFKAWSFGVDDPQRFRVMGL